MLKKNINRQETWTSRPLGVSYAVQLKCLAECKKLPMPQRKTLKKAQEQRQRGRLQERKQPRVF